MRASWATWEQEVPRRKRAVLGFSVALGAFLSRARLERALRGLLVDYVSWTDAREIER